MERPLMKIFTSPVNGTEYEVCDEVARNENEKLARDKIDKEDLEETVEGVLQKAKESGEFDGEVTTESIKTALGYTPEREKMQVFVVKNKDGSHGLYVTGEDGNFEDADLEILSENLMWLNFVYVGDIEVLGGKLFATEEAVKIVFDDFVNKRRIVATLRTESTVVDVTYEYAPTSAEAGTDGQFAISDGQGGIRWVSLTNVGEVGA